MAPKTYGERWHNLGPLGEGGQGFVYRVCDLSGANPGVWALKRLKKMDRVQRFSREVLILRKHAHANIVPLIDAEVTPDGEEEDNYLVMPIAQHGDLTHRLPIYKGQIGSVIEVSLQIAEALEFIHKTGVIHRDIKPGNILFPEAGHKVWVADFGLGYDPEDAWKSPVGELIGPRGFTAPELETATPDQATPSADVYSLGRLIFFMLSGGRHIAREDVFDSKYNDVFANGERYINLRLLLNRMVALQPTRIQQISEAIDELKRLDHWERNAISLILAKNGLSTIDQLKKNSAENLAIRTDNAAARKTEDNVVEATTNAIQDWLWFELTKLSRYIQSDGPIESSAIKPAILNRERGFQVQTGIRTGLIATGGVGLQIELLDDAFHQKYTINFIIGNERTVSISSREKRLPAADPSMVVLPVFTQTHPEQRDKIQYVAFFVGRPIRYDVPNPTERGLSGPTTSNPPVHLHQTFHEGWMSIFRFKASQWPAAQGGLAKMIDDDLQKMLAHIQSPYKAFGP
jgi:serine/threonine protein kinase